ncbi:hypothetical protein A9Q86_01860 [Flavobacteriales bacterium 33_180_T64]|nr:hypothetical protein A9Q86_01860 [Flavobacteriales bacterium 33_180_T64]
MKKPHYILIFIFFLTVNLVQAQDEKESKFNIIGYGGIGYGIVENDNEPNYNLNNNGGEILLNYRINQKFGIATGIGLNELTGNGFNSIGNFYHERTMLKVPLLATMNYNVSDKFRMIANFGLYTQNIAKDEYRFLNNSQKDIYNGWNFGVQLGLGFLFELYDNFSAGINYNGQSDFSNFKTDNNQGINDQQKLKNLNSMGIILMIEV